MKSVNKRPKLNASSPYFAWLLMKSFLQTLRATCIHARKKRKKEVKDMRAMWGWSI
jgi:hypothetical protein